MAFADFGFDKYMYSVLEVNETDYEKCNEADFMTNITRGGRDVFQLKDTRPYYFISGRGFCFHGMKVAVNVEDLPPAPAPAPAPTPAKSSSPSTIAGLSRLPMLIVTVMSWILV